MSGTIENGLQMTMKRELTVLIPTYNERENITLLIDDIKSSLNSINFEVIVIDDNSPDGTALAVKKLNEKYGNIKIIERPAKLGLSSALITGLEEVEAQIIAIMDADLQHSPELLPEMYGIIKDGKDIVIASRYEKGAKIEEWSFWRKMISLSGIRLAHLLLPQTSNVKDVLSGYFMLKKRIIDSTELNTTGFKLLLEILAKEKYDSIVEIPYTFRIRKKGKSKLNFREIINYITLVYKLSKNTKR